jgi:hypothetical protein
LGGSSSAVGCGGGVCVCGELSSDARRGHAAPDANHKVFAVEIDLDRIDQATQADGGSPMGKGCLFFVWVRPGQDEVWFRGQAGGVGTWACPVRLALRAGARSGSYVLGFRFWNPDGVPV